jgi:zinc/manganese transport system substrate-binding protein
MRQRTALLTALGVVAALALGGCSASSAQPASDSRIVAIGAESQYTSLITQVGGKYVDASSIMTNPNTDPHTFEASASVAARVSAARIIVQNGLGYDDFMDKIESASPAKTRVVISAQKVTGLPDSTSNPHLWYDASAMERVASTIAAELTKVQPDHAEYFSARLAKLTASIAALKATIARFKVAHPSTPVATTEPVADYLLTAAGAENLTPWAFQASVMNGTDPSPQDVAKQRALFTGHKVRVFVYNRQVTDAITSTFLGLAHKNDIPVVGVFETMPASQKTYQSWMSTQVAALDKAVTNGG